MAIDLTKVNISLQQFQDISRGEFNAGEVKLASENKLAKMNHHVHKLGKNNETISHAQVIAIKEALIKALSQNGVGSEELDKIRRELGLAPDGVVDRSLAQRSVRPLTRQQIREILDRNAAVINSQAPGNATRIDISSMIYGPAGMSAEAKAKRDTVNARLAEHRQVFINKEVRNFQRVLAGGGEYCDYETRQAMRKIAEGQLEALLVACKGQPRANVPATATFRLSSGQMFSSPTGKSELEFASQLEELIVRLKESGPDDGERKVRSDFKALATPEERQAFFAALPNDPKGGFKARVAAITILRAHGVVDKTALSLPNRLSDADAIVFAQHLASFQEDVAAETLTHDPLLVAMAAKQPSRVASDSKAYVPRDIPEFFNRRIGESFCNGTLLPTYSLLATKTAEEVRLRLGAKGVPDGTKPSNIVDSSFVATVVSDAAGGGRVTVENLREPLLQAALRTGAQRIITGMVTEQLASRGRDDDNSYAIAKIAINRNPELLERLMGAQSPAEVDDIAATFKATVADAIRIFDELKEVYAGVEDRVRKGLAKRLGVSPEQIKDTQLELGDMSRKADDLRIKIGIGNPPLSTKEEFQHVFDKLADDFVTERMASLEAVDALDLSQDVKDDIKVILLTTKKVKGIDVAFLAAEAKKVDTSDLVAKLRSLAGKDEVFQAMAPVSFAMRKSVETMLKDTQLDPDETAAPSAILARMVVSTKPELRRFMPMFYTKPDVKEAILNRSMNSADPAYHSMAFESFANDPEINRNISRNANVKRVLEAPRELAAFRAAGGAERAAAAGYHESELRTLARAFALHQTATGCTSEEAMEAVLDPQSKTRRLFAYGGRFTQSVESFRSGLALMDKFAAWYANLSKDYASKKFDTVTKSNAGSTFVYPQSVKAYEMFVFQDMALNPDVDLNEQDPEKLFGVEHNDAVNFFVRGNGSGCTGTLMKLSPAKRQVVYAAFRTLEPPVKDLGEHRWTAVRSNEEVLARVLRHFDKIAELKATGRLNRTNLNKVLTPDLDLPPDASPTQVQDAIQGRVFALYGRSQSKLMEASILLTTTGCTLTELMNAMNGGEKPAPVADIASTTMKLEEIDGSTNGGRSLMLGDLIRPENPHFIANGQPVLAPENNRFTIKIGGETNYCTLTQDIAAYSGIADKIETLCGKVHVEQANTVMRGLAGRPRANTGDSAGSRHRQFHRHRAHAAHLRAFEERRDRIGDDPLLRAGRLPVQVPLGNHRRPRRHFDNHPDCSR
ncbi:MAG: hypothetical protein IKO65_01260 [Victivallales bacterium]|nr:hypothetical protein [Victivallales bacterium]